MGKPEIKIHLPLCLAAACLVLLASLTGAFPARAQTTSEYCLGCR